MHSSSAVDLIYYLTIHALFYFFFKCYGTYILTGELNLQSLISVIRLKSI